MIQIHRQWRRGVALVAKPNHGAIEKEGGDGEESSQQGRECKLTEEEKEHQRKHRAANQRHVSSFCEGLSDRCVNETQHVGRERRVCIDHALWRIP